MSRKWLEKESPHWIEKGIITKEQQQQLLDCYPERNRVARLLPILASILIGLGMLSFIASNWDGIPNLLKLLIIVTVMCGFYGFGFKQMEKGSPHLGITLVALGLISFGGGIILTGQMFHLVAHNIFSLLVWGVAGIGLTFLFRHTYLFLLTLTILSGAQLYSVSEFNHFSLVAFLFMIVGLGFVWWKEEKKLLSFFFGLSILVQSLIWMVDVNTSWLWILSMVMVLYTVGDWVKGKDFVRPFQYLSLLFGFFFSFLLTTEVNEWIIRESSIEKLGIYYVIVFFALFTLSLFGKWSRGEIGTAWEWMILIPIFLVGKASEFIYILILFFFSGYLLWQGYLKEDRRQVNLGMAAFLFSSLVAYLNLAWDFMPKSLLFILGGIILFGLNYILQKKKREIFETNGGTQDES